MRKYNVPGPRYTSYPTVPYWGTMPTEAQWVEALSTQLERAKQEDLGASIYVHIPFCESLCTYCGCNTRISRNHGVSSPYIETLLQEWSLLRSKLGVQNDMPVQEIHFGGGTPTFLTPSELDYLIKNLLVSIQPKSGYEFSIEVDPRVTTSEHLAVLREYGFKRISMGVQDFDPKVQDIVHRVQSVDQVRTLTEQARAMGFTSVNFDLIYGLPLQTPTSIEQTMNAVQSIRPDRIAFYAYAHVPWIKPGQRRFTENDLPQGEAKRALYELGRAILEANGYFEIGMDHFALTSDSLWKASQERTLHRNFMGYTSRNVQPVLPLGVSSIGDAWTAFAQNEKLLETYVDRVKQNQLPIHRGHVLDREDIVLRTHILNLMTRLETSWKEEDLYTSYLDSVPAKLKELENDELVELTATSCKVSEKGRAFLRNVCMAFDARLARKAPQTALFSQTV